MKKSILYSTLLLLLVLACDLTDSDSGITISGVVVDEVSGNTVADATVSITMPQSLQQSTTTNDSGVFTFQNLELEEDANITLQISKDDYNDAFAQVSATPDRDVSVSTVQLRPFQAGGGDNGDDNGDGGGYVPGTSAGAASIILTNITESSVNVRETGGIINSAISVQVQDSSGRALDLSNSVDVEFRILQGPDDVTLSPETVSTNASGIATTNLSSGFTAGVVKIEARVNRSDFPNLVIRSTPIPITIHGGFPDEDHSSIYLAGDANCPGFEFVGECTRIGVLLGDKFSNPVKEGTAVYFNTTGGVIQGSGTTHTDSDGFVEVSLLAGNPFPNHPEYGEGYATVTATTIGEQDQYIEQQALVLLSGQTANIQLDPENFDIPNAGSQIFNLTITDQNGNPMPRGTTIDLDISDGLDVDGDDNLEVPNALFGGEGITEFSFILLDADIDEDNQVNALIRVTVETPQGGKTEKTFFGTRAKFN